MLTAQPRPYQGWAGGEAGLGIRVSCGDTFRWVLHIGSDGMSLLKQGLTSHTPVHWFVAGRRFWSCGRFRCFHRLSFASCWICGYMRQCCSHLHWCVGGAGACLRGQCLTSGSTLAGLWSACSLRLSHDLSSAPMRAVVCPLLPPIPYFVLFHRPVCERRRGFFTALGDPIFLSCGSTCAARCADSVTTTTPVTMG